MSAPSPKRKATAAKPAPKPKKPAAKKASSRAEEKRVQLESKKLLAKGSGAAPINAAEKMGPAPETSENEKPLCWIELVKNGTMFIARSSTIGGPAKEYKNRVLEDMLTELIVELQEEIQE